MRARLSIAPPTVLSSASPPRVQYRLTAADASARPAAANVMHPLAVNWIGVDVGGERKGFDVAVIDRCRLLLLRRRLTCVEAVKIVDEVEPAVVGIDSPRCCALTGARSRECERALATHICGIRWTPDLPAVDSSDYYAWIRHGFKLYDALASVEAEVIEVFPTASWTRWLGKRGSQRRSAWTRSGLSKLALSSVPSRTNQDQRDAIAAAVTARQYYDGTAHRIGEIVVPDAELLTSAAPPAE